METKYNTATIVSLFPLPIHEKKPGLYPGVFDIPAAKSGDFEVLVIGPSSFPVYMDEFRGSLQVSVLAENVARAIVNDYRPTHLGYRDGMGPGIFWVPGEHDKESIKKNYAKELEEIRQSQMLWFRELVKIADDLWAATNHKHQAISDLQRIAATELKLEREWIIKVDFDNIATCPGCGAEVLKGTAVCRYCQCILDETKHKALKFAS